MSCDTKENDGIINQIIIIQEIIDNERQVMSNKSDKRRKYIVKNNIRKIR